MRAYKKIYIYLFDDVYDVSDLQLQLVLVLRLIVKQDLALSPLRL